MHTYVLKLEPTKRFTILHSKIHLACEVYNYFIRFCRHYYHLYHKTIATQTYTLQKVLTHLKSLKFYERWNALNSQALQDILHRIGRAYKLYFTNQKKHKVIKLLGLKVKIKSKYILKKIYNNTEQNRFMKLIQYNKELQNKLFRVIKTFRVFKALRYSKKIQIIKKVFNNSKSTLIAVVTLALSYAIALVNCVLRPK